MATSNFYKVSADKRQDQLIELSSKNHLLIFGYGKEEGAEQGYNYRKNYDHKPELLELKVDIHTLINQQIDERILNGFSWNGKPVYLSEENQRNFKAAYDLAFQTDGALLPVKFKLGEKDEEPVYHTFTALSAFSDFYTKAIAFINTCLNEGWTEKDSIDWTIFEEGEHE